MSSAQNTPQDKSILSKINKNYIDKGIWKKFRIKLNQPNWFPNSSPARLNFRHYVAAICVAVVMLVIGSWRLIPGVCGVYHDDGVYVATAKSLAEGSGYRLINLPGEPAQTKYPVLYPLFLSFIWKLYPEFPDNLLILQWFTLICGASFIFLSFLFLVRFGYANLNSAIATTLLCATTPYVLYLSTLTLSEMFFAVLLVGALWQLEIGINRDFENPFVDIFLGATLSLPFLCRSIGLAVPITGLLLYLYRKKKIRWVLIGTLITSAPWLIWVTYNLLASSEGSLGRYYTDYAGTWFFSASGNLIKILTLNFLYILHGFSFLVSEGFLTLFSRSLPTLLWELMGLVVLLWLGLAAFRGRIMPLSVIISLFIMCFWPWPPLRFLVPISPFFVLGTVLSVTAVSQIILPERMAKYFLFFLLALFISCNIVTNISYGQFSRYYGYPYSFKLENPAKWEEYKKIFRWLQNNSQQYDIIASGLDTMVFLYTGRTAFRPFLHRPEGLFYGSSIPATGTVKEFFSILKNWKAKYLVILPLVSFSEEKPFTKLVCDARLENPSQLIRVYQGKDPRFEVYEVKNNEN